MSGLKSNHASAVRFSPYKVKLRLADNDEIKFKTVLQDQRNESDRACASAMFCWPVSCDEFFFIMAFINCFADGQPIAGSKRKEVKCFTDMHYAIR